ncbi:DUF3243 family protein [Bacillus lacus]|uniref:DUF3243 family protein n=1 Tax=Metabacillus lacus TaxID=1983721 RepID=A0A7X2IVY1_9BACI|nr:DUF3243 domain-containing protein [Metabacillus lacus]MRX70786.1 DUF3243 family protein [Metabacillus lacus]
MNYQDKDTSIQREKVESKLDALSKQEKDEILENFQTFRNYLGDKVNAGEKLGLSEEALAKSAKITAEYLANNVDPRNREEMLLKELWEAATEEEQNHFSRLLVEFAKQSH